MAKAGRSANASYASDTRTVSRREPAERPRFEKRTGCLTERSNPGCKIVTPPLASDDGPIFSTVAKLVDALRRSIPEGTQNADLKKEALRLGHELLRGTEYEEER